MELKNEIELVLESLKSKGYDRTKIEEDLGYSDNYIDQVLSKGGNKRFLRAISALRDRILQNATQNNSTQNVNEAWVLSMNDPLPWGDFQITMRDYFNLLYDKARKAEEREREYLEIIKSKLISIDASSKEIADDIDALTKEVQAEHRAIMDSIDIAAKQPIGTTSAAADRIEIASQQERLSKGKHASAGKQI